MIELNHINFKYTGSLGQNNLSEINLSIKQGEVVLFCGESGCGKTTLTRLINGLIPHYFEGELSGEIRIDGQSIKESPLYQTAQRVGSVFQNPRTQFFTIDTTSELAFSCENQGLPKDEIINRINETVTNFNLQSLMARSLFKLSGGEKQKIACASVAVHQPDIYVLDEPSSNLDMNAINDLRHILAFWKKQGHTIIISEHRLHYLQEIVDRIFYMKDGRIIHEYTPAKLSALSAHGFFTLGLRALSLDNIRQNKAILISETTAKLQLKDFRFSYKRSKEVLQISEATLPANNIIAIIGGNGAGKSTFAKCLSGLVKKCGMIDNNGYSLDYKKRLKNCYIVMQDVNHQLFTESVLDEVLLSMKKPDMEQADIILESLDLSTFRKTHPMALSGGQKQRVAIASAIASNRAIIIFDEPTSGLDLRHMHEVANNLKKLKELGKTIFVITHDPEFISVCCTHILHLKKGRIFDNYSLDELGTQKMLAHFQNSEKRNTHVKDI